MATSEAEICNLALGHLGDEFITSLEDATDRARLCKRWYPQVRDAALRAHPWNFALVRVALVREATAPTFGFDYQFALPTNPLCLRVLRMSETDYAFKVEGRKLLTDESSASILYISQVTDVVQFDALFAEVVAARLAATIAYAVTGNKNATETMWGLYADKLKEARTIDGMEGTPDAFEATDLIDVR